MMNSKGLIVVWLLALIAIFCAGYIATGVVYTRLMKDFRVEQSTDTREVLILNHIEGLERI